MIKRRTTISTALAVASIALAIGCASADEAPSVPQGRVLAEASSPGTRAVATTTSRPAEPFAKEIEAFEAADAEKMPAPGGIVFYGSSTIRGWKVADAFPGLPVLNRGFGGSQMVHALHYADRACIKYQPKVVVLYEGDNDVGSKQTLDEISDQFRAFADKLAAQSPKTKLVICSVKPSKFREKERAKIDELNVRLAAFAAGRPEQVTFFNTVPLMIDAAGQPKAELFRNDGLHMNEKGYALWNEPLRPILERLMKD